MSSTTSIEKVYYISYLRFPTEKAHGLYVAKTCEAFVKEGIDSTVVVPRRFGASGNNYAHFYGVESCFTVTKLPCIDVMWAPYLHFFGYWIGVGSFGLSVLFYTLFRIPQKKTIVCTNNAIVAFMVSFFARKKVVYEIHDYPKQNMFYTKVLHSVYKIQTNNFQKIERLVHDFSIPKEKIYAVHNGVSISDFDINLSKSDARKQLGLDTDAQYALYTGHLYGWKGVDTLAEAASLMPEIKVLFVGGTDTDIARMKAKYSTVKNIVFCGHKPHADIPIYLKATDVLVLPNTAKEDISTFHTSPMKLFEYMASKRPLIASNIPSIGEVLNNENANLVTPDNPKALASVIKMVIDNPLQSKIQQAFKDVSAYTWQQRAGNIINNLEKDTE